MTTQKKSPALRLHKAAHDPRASALVILHKVLHEGMDSQAAVDEALSSPTLMPSDRGLCTELAYGSLRRYLRLDWFTRRFLSRPDKLPEEMRLALITALYEMAFLRIPHHASVGWAVSHVRNRFGKGLGNVANGALRSMQRQLNDFLNPAFYTAEFADPDEALACLHSVPSWLVTLWRRHLDETQLTALLKASAANPPTGLRLNRSRPGWQEALRQMQDSTDAENSISAVGPAGLAFAGSLPWQAKTLIKEGKASRQSAASYEMLEAMDPASWQGPVWDCCAGRGNKTLALLEQGVAVALASDPSAKRLSGLAAEYARLGLSAPPCPPALALPADAPATDFAAAQPGLPDVFGTILVDAPCSGLGTLARRPDIRIRRTPEDLERLADTQKRILEAVWPKLMSGGRLIYITCTVNPAENEDRIKAMLDAHPDAELEKEHRTPTDSVYGEFFYGASLKKR